MSGRNRTEEPAHSGIRQWFECPRCQRRVGRLFSPDPASDFKCRHCYRLVYRSQYEWLWRHGRYDVTKWIKAQIDAEYEKVLAETLQNNPGIRFCEEYFRNQQGKTNALSFKQLSDSA